MTMNSNPLSKNRPLGLATIATAVTAAVAALVLVFQAPTAKANGEGAVAFEGSMVDLPIVIRAERLLARAASWKKAG